MKTRIGADGRPGGRGHAVARHLPLDRREDPAPPRRAGRARSPTSPSSTPTTRSACSSSCSQAENIDEKRWPARVLAGLIDSWKNRGLTPDQVPAGEAASFANGTGKKLYAAYQERLKVLNAADFGDLLLECIRLFREQPDVLRQYQQRFRYMLVDEYQDTNVAQYLWLRLLAQSTSASPTCRRHRGALKARAPESDRYGSELDSAPRSDALGESAQSGAARRSRTAQEHLLRRRRRPVDLRLARRRGRQHPALRARLSRRQGDPARAQLPLAPRHILAAASHLIAHNEGRLGKTLRTEDEPGEKVQVTCAAGTPRRRRARSARRSSSCSATTARRPHPLDEIAILVRASFQMREFEDRFVTLGLPYRVIGGPRFYERAGDPRRARLSARRRTRRPTTSPSSASSTCPSAASATPPCSCCTTTPASSRIPLTEAARARDRDRRAEAEAARRAARPARARSTAGARRRTRCPHTELAEIVLDESGYTEMWQKDRSRRRRRPAREPQGAGPLDGGVREPRTASSSTSRW